MTKEAEYVEPSDSRIGKCSQTEDQSTAHGSEHHYHCLEQDSTSIPKATTNSIMVTKLNKKTVHECDSSIQTALHVRNFKAETKVESYTQTPTILPHTTETVTDLGTMNSPILYNIEDCDFDDPQYDSVAHKSVAVLHPTQTESSHSLKLPSDRDEMDVVLSAMDVNPLNPELLVDYDDAPEYSDPIDSASVNNEQPNTRGGANDLKCDSLLDNAIYA